jgi:hypothetical protein
MHAVTKTTCLKGIGLMERALTLQGTEPYEVGPDLLAAQRLPVIKAPTGMASGGEAGPDPAKFDIMNADDFGIWQNRTMVHSDMAAAEQPTIPGYALEVPHMAAEKSHRLRSQRC